MYTEPSVQNVVLIVPIVGTRNTSNKGNNYGNNFCAAEQRKSYISWWNPQANIYAFPRKWWFNISWNTKKQFDPVSRQIHRYNDWMI